MNNKEIETKNKQIATAGMMERIISAELTPEEKVEMSDDIHQTLYKMATGEDQPTEDKKSTPEQLSALKAFLNKKKEVLTNG